MFTVAALTNQSDRSVYPHGGEAKYFFISRFHITVVLGPAFTSTE